jgi:acyl carrier protein
MEAAIERSVLSRVAHAIEQTSDRGDRAITSDIKLAADLRFGRMGRIQLGLCLEEAFDIELPAEVLERAVTVGDIVTYLSRHYYRDVDAAWLSDEVSDVVERPASAWAGVENWLSRLLEQLTGAAHGAHPTRVAP